MNVLKFIPAEYVNPYFLTIKKFKIESDLRQAHFLSQILHESGGLKVVQENLNYSAEGLQGTWPHLFPDYNSTIDYVHIPPKIANKVYANRLGNGPEKSGDGWEYRGRGPIEITGKSNYELCGQALGLDLINNPDLLLIPVNGMMSAGWFWTERDLNTLADTGSSYDVCCLVTRKINGALLGITHRWELFQQILAS